MLVTRRRWVYLIALSLTLGLSLPETKVAIARDSRNFLTDAEFESQTDLHTISSCIKYSAFGIRLPKGWREANSTNMTAENDPNDIKTSEEPKNHEGGCGTTRMHLNFTGPKAQSSVYVDSWQVEQNIPVCDWLMKYVHSNHYKLLNMTQVSDRQIDVLYSLTHKGKELIIRATAQTNGNLIMLASYIVPKAQWDAEQSMQEKVVKSFYFISSAK